MVCVLGCRIQYKVCSLISSQRSGRYHHHSYLIKKETPGLFLFCCSFCLLFFAEPVGSWGEKTPVWMAIISLCWFNCVTDLVAPSKRPQWTNPVEILGEKKAAKNHCWERKLINYWWNWQGEGLEGCVCSSGDFCCVIRKCSVKYLNDLFCMLRENYARCIVIL